MTKQQIIAIIRKEKFNNTEKPIIFFVNQNTSKPCYIVALSIEGHIEASLDYYRYTTKKADQEIIDQAKDLLLNAGYSLEEFNFKQKINYSRLHKN